MAYCISRIADYEDCLKEDNVDGPESLIDMMTAKLSVVRHLHDNDRLRFSLMRLYWRYIAGTSSDLQTKPCLGYLTTSNVKSEGEVCQDNPELRRVLTRGQSSNECCWLIKLFYLNYNAHNTLP